MANGQTARKDAAQVYDDNMKKKAERRDIKDLHTRQLLALLKADYRLDYDDEFEFSRDELKAELATREHIPSKAERKKIRQEAAKKGSRKTHKKNS